MVVGGAAIGYDSAPSKRLSAQGMSFGGLKRYKSDAAAAIADEKTGQLKKRPSMVAQASKGMVIDWNAARGDLTKSRSVKDIVAGLDKTLADTDGGSPPNSPPLSATKPQRTPSASEFGSPRRNLTSAWPPPSDEQGTPGGGGSVPTTPSKVVAAGAAPAAAATPQQPADIPVEIGRSRACAQRRRRMCSGRTCRVPRMGMRLRLGGWRACVRARQRASVTINTCVVCVCRVRGWA